MKALLVALVAALQLLSSGSHVAAASATSPNDSRCANLSLDFFPRHISPGQAMDYDFDLSNCGTTTERLTVRLAPTGPCRFIRPSKKTYLLEPGQGFTISILMIGPTCPGDYFLEGEVRIGSRALDHALASFRVRDRASADLEEVIGLE